MHRGGRFRDVVTVTSPYWGDVSRHGHCGTSVTQCHARGSLKEEDYAALKSAVTLYVTKDVTDACHANRQEDKRTLCSL